MDNSQKELLTSAGVDLSGALERFMGNERLYENYLSKFANSDDFPNLQDALERENWSEALGISHNLKGVSGSLGFARLFELLSSQVAMLRRDDNTSAAALMDEIVPEYHRLLAITKEVL